MYVISIDHMSTQYQNFIFSRKDQLKHRLQRDYPELSFHASVRKNQIERITMKLLQLLTCLDLTSIPLRSAHHYLTLIIFLHLYKLTNKIHQHYCISQNS